MGLRALRALRTPLLLAITCTTALASSESSAQQLRFTATVPGNIIGTGNTLGLSKGLNENGPGDKDSIGTFITLGNTVDDMPANAANPWPMGTTYDWKLNGSAAMLALPEAEILYAELLWGGSYQYAPEDVTNFLDTPVGLSANGVDMTVTPDPATKLTISKTAMSGFAVRYYMRSADVTDFVKQAGKGMYEVTGVPATQTTTINSLNAAGWTLVVAYRDEAATTRNLSIFVGGSFVDENTTQDYTVTGFCAPPAGNVEGNVIVSAIEGDANLPGDQLAIAPTTAGPFVNLSGPNNPANNFFCSQLNDDNGNLDMSGTFGDKNQDAIGAKNIAGGRQGWDVTTVQLSSQGGQLKNSQNSAVIRTLTTGDSYAPILAAFSIDVNAPDFAGLASSVIDAPPVVALNDDFTVTAILANNGEVSAQQILFSLPLEAGLTLNGFSVDGQPNATVDAAKLAAGVDVGSLPSNQTKTVKLDLHVAAPPALGGWYFKAKWSYGFEVCPNKPLVPESFSQSKLVQFAGGTSTSSSTGAGGGGSGGNGGASASSGSGTGTGGDGGSGGSGGDGTGGSGASTGGGNDVGDEGSCSCSTPGGGQSSKGAAIGLGLLGLVAFGRSRRRRG